MKDASHCSFIWGRTVAAPFNIPRLSSDSRQAWKKKYNKPVRNIMQPIQKMCHLLSIMKPLGMKHEEMRITSNGKNDPAVFYKESESGEWVWRSRIKGKQKGGEWT